MSNNTHPSGRAVFPACERGGVICCVLPGCQTIYAELMTSAAVKHPGQGSPLIWLMDLELTWPRRRGHSAQPRARRPAILTVAVIMILSGAVARTVSRASFAPGKPGGTSVAAKIPGRYRRSKTTTPQDPSPGLGDPPRPPARRRQSKERCRTCTGPPKRANRCLTTTRPADVPGGPPEPQYVGAGPAAVQLKTPDSAESWA